jgi:hypothetical protein
LVISAAVLAVGCGVKSPPTPSSRLAPVAPAGVEVKPVAEGMLVSFNVPSAPTPSRAVEEIRLYYGYLPLTGDPACPPCPPRLRKFHRFDLNAKAKGKLNPMEGGRFEYLDRNAPLNQEALYQVMLIDASGRASKLSPLARMPRLLPAAAPASLTAAPGDSEVILAWDEVKLSADGKSLTDLAGYIVMRKGPDGTKQLNERPLKDAALTDQTVVNGKKYSYRVHAVRKFGDKYLPGHGSPWAVATPRDMKPPSPPSDLAAASTAEGVYLRFTPSASADVAGYYVYRKGKGGAWAKISEELVVENVYVDKGVKPEKLYYYRVQAVDEAGNASDFSEVLDIVHLP